MQTNNIAKPNWTALHKFVFLFFFVYLTWHIFFTASLYVMIFGFHEEAIGWFDVLYLPSVIWLNEHVFHFTFDTENLAPESVVEFIEHVIIFLGSLFIALVWVVADRKRNSYYQLNSWLRHYVRFFLCIITFAYGIDKLIPVQMPTPNLYQLIRPLGYNNDLLWPLMGSGKVYQVFAGAIEVVGALMILFRRTTPLGLVILAGVYINVVVMNYAFSIGVLYFALLLLVATLFLLYPYLKDLVRFFIFHESIGLRQESTLPLNPRMNGIVLKGSIIIVVISFLCNFISAFSSYQLQKETELNTLIYKIEYQIENNDTIPPLEYSQKHWNFWVEMETEGIKQLTLMSKGVAKQERYTLTHNETASIFNLKPTDNNKNQDPIDLHYTRFGKDTLELEGMMNGQQIKIRMHELNIYNLPLLRQEPHFLPK